MPSKKYVIKRLSTELEYREIAIENDAYAIILSDRVKVDIFEGKISIKEIDNTIFHMPHSLFSSDYNKDFLLDCKQTGVRMVVSKSEYSFNILLARRSENFAIY